MSFLRYPSQRLIPTSRCAGCPDEGDTVMKCKEGFVEDAPLCAICKPGYIKQLRKCDACEEPRFDLMAVSAVFLSITWP